MSCSAQCRGIEREFDAKQAQRMLDRYRRQGPRKTTRILLDALRARGVQGATLLDIGGGVGTIQHELIDAGVVRAVGVDASNAYLEAHRQEARRRGHEDRIDLRFGDFVDLAATIEPADVVTLDRVICCYDDMESLVGLAGDRARRLLGLVYPRVEWWTKVYIPLENLYFRARRSDFRSYLHSDRAVQALLGRLGFARAFLQTTAIWEVEVHERL